MIFCLGALGIWACAEFASSTHVGARNCSGISLSLVHALARVFYSLVNTWQTYIGKSRFSILLRSFVCLVKQEGHWVHSILVHFIWRIQRRIDLYFVIFHLLFETSPQKSCIASRPVPDLLGFCLPQVMFVVLFDALILPFQLAFKMPGFDQSPHVTFRISISAFEHSFEMPFLQTLWLERRACHLSLGLSHMFYKVVHQHVHFTISQE